MQHLAELAPGSKAFNAAPVLVLQIIPSGSLPSKHLIAECSVSIQKTARVFVLVGFYHAQEFYSSLVGGYPFRSQKSTFLPDEALVNLRTSKLKVAESETPKP